MEFEQLDAGGKFEMGNDQSFYPVVARFRIDDASLPYRLTLSLGVVAGMPVCRSLEAEQREGGLPVTRRGLNAVPVGRLVEEIASRYSLQLDHARSVEVGQAVARPSTPEEQRRIQAMMRPPRGRPQAPEARRELVARVAALYQELTDNQINHPKPAIAEQLGYSTSYVGALVAEARTAGLLGRPAGPGRAGNVPVKSSPAKRRQRKA